MIICPLCPSQSAGEVSLASHLITTHGMEPQTAAVRAREALERAALMAQRVFKRGRGRAR